MFNVDLRGEELNFATPRDYLIAELPREVFWNRHFPLIWWISPWGNTVFNARQCQALIPELEQLRNYTDTQDKFWGLPQLEALIALAKRAASEPDLYLVFQGD